VTSLREELRAASIEGETALTLGVFDGVHLGHRHVLGALRGDARQRGLAAVALTFANHPLSVLRPDVDIVMLAPLAERIALLTEAGADHVVPIAFTTELSQLGAAEFVGILRDELSLRHLVIGPDFALGRDRQGTVPVLTALGEQAGFTVRVVEPLALDGQPARSTAIRQALATGDVQTAAAILGRSFSVSGLVVAGEGRGGDELGFPTCNLGIGASQALPADGVFAAWVVIDGKRLAAAASIGTKPTFHDDGPRVVEAFILDFDGDLYGSEARIEFVRYLRPQERFDSAEALTVQMARDVEAARTALGLPAANTPQEAG
jgi:riboflavin kinase/FMN adenylyltransferase